MNSNLRYPGPTGISITYSDKQLHRCRSPMEAAALVSTLDPIPSDSLSRILKLKDNVDAFLVCMETMNDIDFCVTDKKESSMLHYIASRTSISDEDAARMLRAVVQHLEGHPGDKVADEQRWKRLY